jgi:putative FmdB family regulatory protein
MTGMPIYEYACKKCSSRFETLVQGSVKPSCPSCGSAALDKQLSVFAVSSGGSTSHGQAPGPCGSCGDPRGPGSCRFDH